VTGSSNPSSGVYGVCGVREGCDMGDRDMPHIDMSVSHRYGCLI